MLLKATPTQWGYWLPMLLFVSLAASAPDGSTRCSDNGQDVQGAVCLVGGDETQGRLEIYVNGTWMPSAPGDRDYMIYNQPCIQLGYRELNRAKSVYYPGENRERLARPLCLYNYKHLSDCEFTLVDEDVQWRYETKFGYIHISCSPYDEGEIRIGHATGLVRGPVYIQSGGALSPVCNAQWTVDDARVVCVQQGYDGGHPSDPVKSLDARFVELGCVGNESSVSDCSGPWMVGYCPGGLIATVQCNKPPEGAIRLRGTERNIAGVVNIYHNDRWGAICVIVSESYSNAVNIACHQVTGTDFDWEAYMNELRQRARLRLRFQFRWLHTGVLRNCSGGESNLNECVQKQDNMPFEMNNDPAIEETEDYPWGYTRPCNGVYQDLVITCNMPVEGSLALRGGDNSTSGRLEITWNGRLRTVCSNGWTDNNSQVACRQLGYQGGTTSPGGSFERGYGPIALTNVHCNGDEESITDCTYDTPDVRDSECSHDEDVGIVCD